MNYELLKNEFIKLKKEELNYINNIFKINRNLSEYKKLETYRKLQTYVVKINKLIEELSSKILKDKKITINNFENIIIEFDLDKNYLSSATFLDEETKISILEDLGINIETFKFKLTLYDLIQKKYRGIDYNVILNNLKLIETPIYIFCGYYDTSENCNGPCFEEPDIYIYGMYENINNPFSSLEEIPKKEIDAFVKDKIIIKSKEYVNYLEIKKIFKEELLHSCNKNLHDCVLQTNNRIEELNHVRSPEYKEKILLDKINELYQKVKGEFIQKEVLYNGGFLEILRETYKLPNEKTVEKEKVIKNGGKNSVIVIAITQDKKYIITFQNRIKDKIIAEFPSGYIENGEEPIEAAKRELQEETGYISDELFIVDEAFTSPGIDNSVTYIVITNNCIKTEGIKTDSTELVNYGLFSEVELKYLISSNIMNGAMSKLAYYNLVNNVDDYTIIYTNSNKKIYKMQRKKTNPLHN